ncbi:MAG: ABC transporter substrate-binding protein [Methanomassiliicoccales archaeon]
MDVNKSLAAIAVAIVLVVAAAVGAITVLDDDRDEENIGEITISDYRGNVTLSKYPENIVSLGSSFTEVLFSIGAGEQIVGVDKYSDYPPAALEKANVGSGYYLSTEALMELDPDLVICWGYQTETIETLEGLDVPLLVFYPSSLQEIQDVIIKLGNATGNDDNARDLVNGMQETVDQIDEALQNVTQEEKPKVYFELRSGKSVGSGSITDELIEMAGGINIYANDSQHPEPKTEYIIDQDPDIIIVEDQHEMSHQDIASQAGWDQIDAVQEDRIYRINGDLVSSNPRVVDALETFAHWFHPDLV